MLVPLPTILLVIFQFTLLLGDEVTHMPQVEEITLSPFLAEARNGKKFTYEPCREPILEMLNRMSSYFGSLLRNGYTLKRLHVCSLCNAYSYTKRKVSEPLKANLTKLVAYKLGDYSEYMETSSVLVEATVGYPEIHLKCSGCVFTDDGGKQHTGNFSSKWLKPLFSILAVNNNNNFVDNKPGTGNLVPKTDIVLMSAANMGPDTLLETCEGDDEAYLEVCRQVKESGELTRVFHAASERLLDVDKAEDNVQGEDPKFRPKLLYAMACNFETDEYLTEIESDEDE